jgi:hypothetical protein
MKNDFHWRREMALHWNMWSLHSNAWEQAGHFGSNRGDRLLRVLPVGSCRKHSLNVNTRNRYRERKAREKASQLIETTMSLVHPKRLCM